MYSWRALDYSCICIREGTASSIENAEKDIQNSARSWWRGNDVLFYLLYVNGTTIMYNKKGERKEQLRQAG
jgi:hypothetical protein